jgi:hypothetical protein
MPCARHFRNNAFPLCQPCHINGLWLQATAISDELIGLSARAKS